ncbi:MAG: response regulator transcription factor [Oscillospiraceae bacterium]|nr:response regulator transcription factor [Oscillospiraceae bacterium]
MEKILVVDDDKNICEILRLYIQKEGFNVIVANDGIEAIRKFESESPHLIVLDIMIPKLDGWQVCNEIRKKSNIPIIMLTAKSEVFDKVLGLSLGADDYLPKPFESKELVARIKAVLRRNKNNTQETSKKQKEISYENIVINLSTYELILNKKNIDIPPKEIQLLFFLASNPNCVFTREKLLNEIWGFDCYGDTRTIDVHIKRLREKIEGASNKWSLKTVWGIGYKFEVKK